jgi:polar amino acid transport system substrate-binding protein
MLSTFVPNGFRHRANYRTTIALASAVALFALAACSSAASGNSKSEKAAGATHCPSSATGSTGTDQAAALRAQLPESIRSSCVLRVGTDPELRPAEFIDPTSHAIVGYDPDLIKAMANVLGLNVEFVQSAYAGLIPGLLAGRSDILGGAVTDTQTREQQVDFVGYMKNYQISLATASNPHHISGDPLSICGLRVGLEIGGVDQQFAPLLKNGCAAAHKPAPTITNYTGQSAKTLALQSGRVDATFYTPIAFPVLQKATNNAFVSFQVSGVPVQLLGIAVPKNQKGLQNAVLGALKIVQANGQYHQILTKWGVSDLEFMTPGINLQTTDPSAIK